MISYFYPRSPRGERLQRFSIFFVVFSAISIHAPREGSDKVSVIGGTKLYVFLSTLPARGATNYVIIGSPANIISIHAPREGSDTDAQYQQLEAMAFLSTLPARGATIPKSDILKSVKNFYPRSPRGERPSRVWCWPVCISFLSTLPARGATQPSRPDRQRKQISTHAPREGSDGSDTAVAAVRLISIHAPREGSDTTNSCIMQLWQHFYPRSPRGERLLLCVNARYYKSISIHAPREGSDCPSW